MVQSAALAAILLIFAFAFWRPLRRMRNVLGVQHLLSTGHAFLILGFWFGLVAGERSEPLVDDLGPVVAFVAGWVGFATGMRFEFRVLRTVRLNYFVAALMPAVTAALVVGSLGVAVLQWAGAAWNVACPAALVLAAAAASSGPTLIAMLRVQRAGRSSRARPVLRLIEFSAGVDDIVVVLLAVFAFALFRVGNEPVPTTVLIAAAVGGAALLGLITWLFLGGSAREDERLLLGLAMLAFTAGFASWLHFSPATVAAVAAMVLVNLPGGRAQQLLNAIRRVERPAVVILMTVIGVHSAGALGLPFALLVVAMTAGRLLAKRGTSGLLPHAPAAEGGSNGRWGSGLAPQGTLGLMVALSYFHVWRDDTARTILAAVALASIVNELIAPWLLLRVLRDTDRHGAPPQAVRGSSP